MPSPLKWNADRQWMFDVSMSRPIIHLLRDHVTLITDLSKDWSTGPSADFNRFVPITYILKVTFKDIHLHLYVNDHNVIDFPLVDQQNCEKISGLHHFSFLTCGSQRYSRFRAPAYMLKSAFHRRNTGLCQRRYLLRLKPRVWTCPSHIQAGIPIRYLAHPVHNHLVILVLSG
jgi:BLTP1 N-terminal region